MGKTLQDAEPVQTTLIDGAGTRHSDGRGYATREHRVLRRPCGWRPGGRQRAPGQSPATRDSCGPGPAWLGELSPRGPIGWADAVAVFDW
jgi:hypothetical protein